MEFGIFVQAHVPHRRLEHEPDFEHTAIMGDVELVKAADAAGFKYAWVSEHHFLEEYSHISANEVYLGFLAAVTERIHIGSGIFNLSPKVNHPVRVAERVAMLDHLSDGRYEFGTGRGAGSLEMSGFGIMDTNLTKAMWDEVIREFVKMWGTEEYSHEGESFSLPTRNILPKPWRKPHPPMWVAAGNPPTFEKAARLGLGVLGFNMSPITDMGPMISAYKDAIGEAEPVGAYVNDNVMVTNTAVVAEDGQRAREIAAAMGSGRHSSLVYRYHDTFPKPAGVPDWPATLPEPNVDHINWRIEQGYMLCGDPDEVIAQMEKYESVGADQISFGLPIDMPHEAALETIRLFGEHVIPKLDPEPTHRTSRFRDAAA